MIYTETKEYKLNGVRQDLPGFDSKYQNIVDYILKITEEIWEQKHVSVIYDTYEENILIHLGRRTLKGIKRVIESTEKTLRSFPDRKMEGEAVIWSTEGSGNFYSSHRIASTATNLGDTEYGKATGKTIFFRTIADCMTAHNKIYEEWLVRDNLHMVQQLGFDAVEIAKKDKRYQDHPIVAPDVKNVDEKKAPANLDQPAELIFLLIGQIWQKQEFEKLDAYYHDHAVTHTICNEDLIGTVEIGRYMSKIFEALPDARISIERITSNIKRDEIEIAVRWLITGTHKGKGFFDQPSGKILSIPGINHYVVKNGKISEEWMLFDGLDVLCQIHA